jgi:hypothetical protein
VSRIPFGDGVQLLLGAGLAPDKVLKILTREIGEDDGALGLWQDGKRLSPAYVRTHLRFTYSANAGKIRIVPINPMEITLKGPLIGVVQKSRFELDAEQIEALIAKLTKPKREPKPRGPREHPLKKPLIDEYDRCLREEGKTLTAEALHAHAKELEKRKKKKRVPGLSTIGTWLREHKSQRS